MAPYSAEMRFPTAVLAVNTIGLILSFFAVVMRFWARWVRQVKLRLSDYTIIVSWVFTLGLVISENYTITTGGVGQVTAEVSPEQILFSIKQFIVIGVCGVLAVTFVKVSILDFLLSVFSRNDRFRIAAYITMAITVCYGLSFTITTLASCRPFAANWDKISNPNYTCINTSAFYVAQAAIGAFLDCLIVVLPLPVVWQLSMKTSRKVALTLLFAIGIVICAISIVRLVYNTDETYMVTHFTEYAGIAALLGALEANLSIICACLPTMPPLVAFVAEKIKTSLGSSRGGLKRILSSFTGRNQRPSRDSFEVLSWTDKKGRSDEYNDLELARVQKQNDRLYPLSVNETRGSFDEANPARLNKIVDGGEVKLGNVTG